MTTSLFKLPAKERIKSRSLFDLLFESGKGLRQHPIRMVWLSSPFNPKNPVRIAVGVPKKNMRKAVHRNRMKRLMREAYRLNKAPLIELASKQQKGFSIMFIAQVNAPLEFAETQEKIILLLQRLITLHAQPSK